MPITITQIVKKRHVLKVDTKFKVWDYEDRKWIDAKVGYVYHDGILVICEEGLTYKETIKELEDPQSYKFNLL